MKKITIFGGSDSIKTKEYIQATDQLAQVMVENEISLVYGGNHTGLVGRLADEILYRGGEVIAVIPENLVTKEIAYRGLTMVHIVQTIPEGKALMAELSEACIGLPGNIANLEEMIEVFTQPELRNSNIPYGLLNIAGCYDKIIGVIKKRVESTFLKSGYTWQLLIEQDPATLIQQMHAALFEYVDR